METEIDCPGRSCPLRSEGHAERWNRIHFTWLMIWLWAALISGVVLYDVHP